MNILITGAAHPQASLVTQLQNFGWNVDILDDEKSTVEEPEKYDAVVCNGLFLYSPIDSFTQLKVIQLTSAGLDRVPLDYINEHCIKLFNARGVYSIPMAEWVVANILSCYKSLPEFSKKQKAKLWSKNRSLRELTEKRIAIIGAGNIGDEIAKRLRAFDAHIDGFDIKKLNKENYDCIKEIANFSTIDYDIVVITAPHTPDTHNLLNKNNLIQLPLGAIIIAISRGGIINESELINVLNDREDIIAILDVFSHEPLDISSPLWHLKNVHVFPHNSFVGEFNQSRLHSLILSNIKNLEASLNPIKI